MNKVSKSLLVATSVFVSCSVQAISKDYTLDPTTGYITINPIAVQDVKDRLDKSNVNVPGILIDAISIPALQNVINDGKFINNTVIKPNKTPTFSTFTNPFTGQVSSVQTGSYYNLSSLAGTLNGHSVNIFTTGGTALGQLGKLKLVDAVTGGKITKATRDIKLQGIPNDTVVLQIDGNKILDSSQILHAEDALGLLRTLDILPALNTVASTNLGPMSPSGFTSQIVYDKLATKVHSHKEQKANASQTDGVNFSLADIKYEQVQFNKGGENGSIQGVLLAMSTEIAGVEVGAYIPYDYLSFKSFDAHRTGAMLYAKHDWQLPMNLQLLTMANFNGIATYVTKFSVTGTVGGGLGTSLTYDDGGDFVPQISFSAQYNKDYYPVVGKYIKDDEQYLVKMGASLGYRLFEGGTLNAGFIYTRDVTGYRSILNKNKDNDYFDITVGGSYALADTWQINLNYKRILGLDSYYTNAVFLGTSIGF